MRSLGVVLIMSLAVACSDDSKSPSPVDTGNPKKDTGGKLADTGGTKTDLGKQPDGKATQADSSALCIPPATGGPIGMNDGQDCTSCHNGSKAFKITLGGTLYDSSGTSVVAGATVRITDKNGTVKNLVTGSKGNFYTTDPITFPAKVMVSKCPDSATMPTEISAGGCASCHGVSTGKIHLP